MFGFALLRPARSVCVSERFFHLQPNSYSSLHKRGCVILARRKRIAGVELAAGGFLIGRMAVQLTSQKPEE